MKLFNLRSIVLCLLVPLTVTVLFLSCESINRDRVTAEENAALIRIIPQPNLLQAAAKKFTLSAETPIIYNNPSLALHAALLSSGISDKTGSVLEIKEVSHWKRKNKAIELLIDIQNMKGSPEAYALTVDKRFISIRANAPAGILYGIQSLLQVIPDAGEQLAEKSDERLVPCVVIEDTPKSAWRGLMLDCSRTFLSKSYVLKTIDILTILKMNVLHLHLTDDQGWRLEIKNYPELTQTASMFASEYNDNKSGYYTQDDIREILDYATARNIIVVPEIEMPGHSTAVFSAFPQLSCAGKKLEIFPFFKGPGITEDIFCAGNEETFTFLENVMTEVIDLFPSQYIHIGGDEAPKARWEKCEKCQQRILTEGLEDEHELQSYFIKRMDKFISSKGRTPIGWDEILEGGLADNSAVMSWRGMEGGIEAAKLHHPVVMSPTSHCYFDYTYEKISTERAYSFNPIPEVLNTTEAHYILGGQACMWTHIDRTEELIDKQIYPRLVALSEALWSEEKDYADFEHRLQFFYPILDNLSISYMNEKGQ